MADTFKTRLETFRWHFFEKGMTRVWNELYDLATASIIGTVTGTIGSADYASNYNPDIAKRTVTEEEGRDGTGAIYQGTKFPPLGAGFIK